MGIASFFKKLFGSTKQATDEWIEKSEGVLKKTKENTATYIEEADDYIEKSIEETKEASAPLIEKAIDYSQQATEVVSTSKDKVGNMLGEILKSVKDNSTETLINIASATDLKKGDVQVHKDETLKKLSNRFEEDAD